MFKSKTNSTEMYNRIVAAFKVADLGKLSELFFEYGQWWVSVENGAIYSVVDAVGGKSIDGFDFEEIEPPYEE